MNALRPAERKLGYNEIYSICICLMESGLFYSS